MKHQRAMSVLESTQEFSGGRGDECSARHGHHSPYRRTITADSHNGTVDPSADTDPNLQDPSQPPTSQETRTAK